MYIFDKVGTKYYIKGYSDISDEELEALIENRRGKNPNSYGNNNTGGGKELASVFLRAIYLRALEEDIDTENAILKGDNDTIYLSLSKHEIACISGIRNDTNYKIANNYPGYYSNYYNLDYTLVKNIFSFLSNATYNIVNSMIEIINKEKLALIETYMDIEVVKDIDEDGRMLEEEDIEYNKEKGVLHTVKASIEQKENIEKTRLEVAKTMGFKNVSSVYLYANKKQKDDFHKELNKATLEQYGIYSSMPKVGITASLKILEEYMKKNESTISKDKGRKIFIEKRLASILSRVDILNDEKKIAKKIDKKGVYYYNTIQLREGYIKDVELMIDSLINPNSASIPDTKTDVDPKIKTKDSYIKFLPRVIEESHESVGNGYVLSKEEIEELNSL